MPLIYIPARGAGISVDSQTQGDLSAIDGLERFTMGEKVSMTCCEILHIDVVARFPDIPFSLKLGFYSPQKRGIV